VNLKNILSRPGRGNNREPAERGPRTGRCTGRHEQRAGAYRRAEALLAGRRPGSAQFWRI